MDIGITIPSAGDSWKVVERAEELGFTHAWFYDTQLLCADVFVSMAAAAVRTKRIRLGTGVLIPTNRIAPVTANAFASLNQLAPGRIDFGIGTGFTGRRTMGANAMKLADMEDYIRVVYGMLAGETVDFDFEGKARKVRFLDPQLGLIDIEHPIQLHISAFGARSRDMVARHGAGWLNIVFTERTGLKDIDRLKRSWQDAGNTDELYATMFTLGCVLEPGEPYDSPRAMVQAGPAASVFLHAVVEREAITGEKAELPPEHRALADRYHALYQTYDPKAPYLQLHRGHMMYVRDDERPLITPELIRDKSFTGSRDVLIERLTRLKDAGYKQIAVQLMPGHEDAIDDWLPILKAVQAA